MSVDVSIVIAAWNAARFINNAIASALAQTGVNLEVIVVNDASTDDTRLVVGALQDKRLRMLDLQENGGPSAARNAGFAAAQGRWVAILDADDTMEPDRLENLIALGEAHAAHIVIDNLRVTQTGRPPHLMFPAPVFDTMKSLSLETFIASNTLFAGQFNLGYTKPVFRRSFIVENDIKYDEKIRIGEDFLFLAEALAKGGLCVISHSAGYIYSVQEGSISRVLRPIDVSVMLAADDRLVDRVNIPRSAQKAMNKRRRSLVQGMAFLTCVDQIKARQLVRATKTLLATPSSILLFRLPIVVRMARVRDRLNRPR